MVEAVGSRANRGVSRRAMLRTLNLGFMAAGGLTLLPRAGLCASQQGAGSTAGVPLDGSAVIINYVSGRLLEAVPAAGTEFARTRLNGRDGAPGRQWRVSAAGPGLYTILNLSTGQFLDADGDGNKRGGAAIRLSSNSSPCQWQLAPLGGRRFLIRHAASGKLLDADTGGLERDGTRVQLFGTDAEGMPSREWLLITTNDYQQTPSSQHSFRDAPRSFDLLIAAPFAFADLFEEFRALKRNQGLESHLIAFHPRRTGAGGVLDDFPGSDDPERIKRAIEYAHRIHRAKYIMLVGDASLFPVRWRYVREADSPKHGAWAGWHDGTYRPSDLYYASLYHHVANGRLVFDTWDANRNGRYNEQQWGGPPLAITYNPDQVDGYPDVAVGRVPAHRREEVQIYLKKVMAYEAAAAHAAGRQTFGFLADKNYEGGDDICDQAKSLLPRGSVSSTPSALLNASSKDRLRPAWTRGSEASLSQFTRTCFWIFYCGHGGTRAWSVPGANFGQIRSLKNGPNYPIVFAAACDTGAIAGNPPFGPYQDEAGHYRHFYYHTDAPRDKQIDERDTKGTVLAYVKKPLAVPPPNAYDLPASHDRTVACAWLFNAEGGAIAYFGEAVVCEDDKGRDLQKNVFTSLRSPARRLGDVWLTGQRRYHDDNKHNGEVFRAPRIFLGIMACFGDPSLHLPALA